MFPSAPVCRRLFHLLAFGLLLGSVPLQAQEDDDDFFVFDEDGETPTVADPFEPVNRAIFGFNDKAYRYVLKPVARGLRVLPTPVRVSMSNFFTNLRAPISAFSALLQADPKNAGSEAARFVVNTTVGIVGLFDPATSMGLIQDEEDLGQTLGRWGVGHGFYIVMPFVGPTSLRDVAGQIPSNTWNPLYRNLDNGEIIAINVVSGEVELSLDQDTYEAFYDSALDPYAFFRSAWEQNRAGRVAR